MNQVKFRYNFRTFQKQFRDNLNKLQGQFSTEIIKSTIQTKQRAFYRFFKNNSNTLQEHFKTNMLLFSDLFKNTSKAIQVSRTI